MDSFEWNKIFGAVLVALLLIVGARNVAKIVFAPEDASPDSYRVEVAQDNAASGTAEPPVAFASLLAQASVSKGARAAKKCISCHSFERGGAHKIGPALWSIVGRTIGSQEEFSYSRAMANFGGRWDVETLNGYLKNPKAYVKGTNMAFVGLRKDTERANVIAYLRSLQ